MDRRAFLAATAGVAVAGLNSRALFAAPRARVLVTADASSRVDVVDPATGRRITSVRTPRLPRSIERVGDSALVAHSELGVLTIVRADLTTRVIAGQTGEPRYVAAHPDGRTAFVTDSARNQIAVFDMTAARVVARVRVGGPARHLSLDPTGRRLWAALGTKARSIAVVDVSWPRRPALIRVFAQPILVHDVVFHPAGREVWVSSGDRGELLVYDAGTRTILRRLRGDAPPQHIAFSPDGRRVFVTSGDDGLLRVHRPDGRLVRTTRIPPGSFNVTATGEMVVSPSLTRGTLCVMGPGGTVRRAPRLAPAAHDACILPSLA